MEYVHDKPPLTVGQLRQILEGLPDGMLMTVAVPSAPGRNPDQEMIIVDAGHGWITEGADTYIDDRLSIVVDYASGEWAI